MHARETCHHQRSLSLMRFLSISSFRIQFNAARPRHWHLKPATTADKIYSTEQTVQYRFWGPSKQGYGTPSEPHITRLRSSSSFECSKRKFTRYQPRLSRAYLDKISLFLEGEPSMVTHQKCSLYGFESVVDLSLLQGTTRWAYSAAFYGVACFRDGCGLLRNGFLNLRRVGSRYSRNRVRKTSLEEHSTAVVQMLQALLRFPLPHADFASSPGPQCHLCKKKSAFSSVQVVFYWFRSLFVALRSDRACIPGFGLHVLSSPGLRFPPLYLEDDKMKGIRTTQL